MSQVFEEKPLTLSQLIQFYQKTIEPRFEKIEKKLEEHDKRFDEIDARFDDLYKKFEGLKQEYIVANEQMKRLIRDSDKVEQLREGLVDLRNKVAHIQERIDELERQIQ